MEERLQNFLWAMKGDKEDQLAISQCLDLETTRVWLYNEICGKFYRLEKEEGKEEEENVGGGGALVLH